MFERREGDEVWQGKKSSYTRTTCMYHERETLSSLDRFDGSLSHQAGREEMKDLESLERRNFALILQMCLIKEKWVFHSLMYYYGVCLRAAKKAFHNCSTTKGLFRQFAINNMAT